jgi:hypothetical protein
MMSYLQSFIHMGVTDHMDSSLRQKIIISNIVSVILCLIIGLPFTLITYIEAPLVAFEPAIVTGGVVLTPLLNRFGYYRSSRIVSSFLLIMAATMYHAFIVSGDSEPIIPIMLTQLSFSFAPFLYFQLKEWREMLFCVLLSTLLIMGYDQLSSWIEFPVDDTYMREKGFYYYFLFILAIFISYGCILGLIAMHDQESQKNKKLVREMEQQQSQLMASEEEMRTNLEMLQQAQDTENKRNWVSSHLTDFARYLRRCDNLEQMSKMLVSRMTQFLQAQQSGFYMVHAGEERLELVASYAYSNERKKNRFLPLTQGLLGQAYLEKDKQYYTDIPEDYAPIPSGLGKARPVSLLIYPFTHNDEVICLLEITCFHPLEAHHIEFVEKAGEAVAAFCHSYKINDQTNKLLQEAQRDLEINKSQEEEMRQNLEELAATEEDMHRKEQEYQVTIQQLRKKLKKIKDSSGPTIKQ